MRRYDEPVLVLFTDAPRQFIHRGKLLRVLEVQSRWRRSAAWWTSPQVQAARGQTATGEETALDGDLLGEREVWRVEAARGSHRGVYELARVVGTEQWVLEAVCD